MACRCGVLLLPLLLCLALLAQQAVLGFVPSPCAQSTPAATALQAKKQTFKNLDDMIAKIDTPLLLDVYAVWCGPCQMLAPELERLGAQMKGELQVAKVDSDKYPELASRLRVQGLPTCILFKDGQEIHRFEGFYHAGQMEQVVRQKLAQHAQ